MIRLASGAITGMGESYARHPDPMFENPLHQLKENLILLLIHKLPGVQEVC